MNQLILNGHNLSLFESEILAIALSLLSEDKDNECSTVILSENKLKKIFYDSSTIYKELKAVSKSLPSKANYILIKDGNCKLYPK